MKKALGCFFIFLITCPIMFTENLQTGIDLFYKGDYSRAEKIMTEIYLNNKDSGSITEATALKFLGNIYWRMQDYKVAEKYFNKALVIYRKNNDLKETANIYNNLGTLYRELGNYSEAQDSFNSAVDILKKKKDYLGLGHVYLNMAVLFETVQDYKKAEEQYSKIEELIKEHDIKDLELHSNFRLGLGNLRYRQNRFEDALKEYVQANFIYTVEGSRLGIAYSLINMARAYIKLGNLDSAEKSLVRALDLIENIRGNISSERTRSTFLENKIYVYELLTGVYLAKENNARAFETVERAKARTFIDMLATRQLGESRYSDSIKDLIKQEHTLSLAIDKKIDKQDVSEELRRLAQVRKQLKQKAPQYSSLVTVENISADELQSKLDNMIILEYFLGTEAAFAFVVTDSDIKAFVLDESTPEIEARIQKFRRSSTGADLNILDKSWQDDLNYLYETLIEPVEGSLDPDKLICIIPHKLLHHLPFNALVSKIDKKAKTIPKPEFLIEKYKIVIAPTANILKFLVTPEKKSISLDKILMMANAVYPEPWNELAYADLEADELKLLIPETTIFKKEKATETYFKNNSNNFSIIHLATHGILYPEAPLDSRILLTKDGQNDGYLTVEEIFNLELKADLIILSACESGKLTGYTTAYRKTLPYGDDIVGLTRALIYAGTPVIISSLWEINDKATKDLLLEFYKNLKSGDDYISAFRNAQLTLMKKQTKYYHPNYWASFQIYY